jgi:hypothetical protein
MFKLNGQRELIEILTSFKKKLFFFLLSDKQSSLWALLIKEKERKNYFQGTLMSWKKKRRNWNAWQLYKIPLRDLNLRSITQNSRIGEPGKQNQLSPKNLEFWPIFIKTLCFNEFYIPDKSIPTILKRPVYDTHIFTSIVQYKHIPIIMCNGPTNAHVCNKTLIQMSHIKTLKITPTCFDHQMIETCWSDFKLFNVWHLN